MKNLKYTKLVLIFFVTSFFSFVTIHNILIASELAEELGDLDIGGAGQNIFDEAAVADEVVDNKAIGAEENVFNPDEIQNQIRAAQQDHFSSNPVGPSEGNLPSVNAGELSIDIPGADAISAMPEPAAPGADSSAENVKATTSTQQEATNQSAQAQSKQIISTSEPIDPIENTLSKQQKELLNLGQCKADLATATENVSKAKGELDSAMKNGNSNEIATAKTKLNDAVNAQEAAKAKLSDAQAPYESASEEVKASMAKQASELKAQMKTKLDVAQSKFDAAQTDLKKFEADNPAPDPTDSKYNTSNDPENNGVNNEQYKTDLENYKNNEDLKLKTDAFNKAQEELEVAQKNFKSASANVESAKSIWSRAGSFLKDKLFSSAKFLLEQAVTSIAFSIVPEILQAYAQNRQNEALYQDITSKKTFAGIDMQIPSGLVPSQNPSGGAFIYYDVQPGAKITDSYLRDSNRRWFVSYDPSGYSDPGTFYIGQSSFPDSMLELTTGLIFDASGDIILPAYNGQQIPFTSPLMVLLDDGDTASKSVIWDSTTKTSIQNTLNGFVTDASGTDKGTSYSGDLNPVNALTGALKSYITGPTANKNVKYLFTTVNGEQPPSYPPIMHPIFQHYVTPTGNALVGFGKPAVEEVAATSTSTAVSAEPANWMSLQEFAGIGALAEVFGSNYFNIFIDNKNAISQGKIQSFYNTIKNLTYTQPAGVTDSNMQLVGTTLELTNESVLTAALTSIAAGGNLTMNGFDPRDHLLAHGLPIYQTDSTPTAQFLKNFVSATSSSVLAGYVHDIVVPLDDNRLPTVAMIPTVSGGTIQYQQNPAVQYITSLVSGLTYQQNMGYTSPVKNSAGNTDNSIAATILSYITPSGKWQVSAEVAQQISQIRMLFNTAITQGPFNLGTTGLQAYRVDLSSMMNAVNGLPNANNNEDQWIANIAQQIPNKLSNYTSDEILGFLVDSFVYMIPNALNGIDANGNTISVPDYVIPVMKDTMNSNCYLMTPLGYQATIDGNIVVGMPSNQIFGLISLVTSKFYDPYYTLKNDPVNDLIVIGNPPSVSTTLGTAFVETDFNPLNYTKRVSSSNASLYTANTIPTVTIPPLYFLNLNTFSFSSGLLPILSNSDPSISTSGATFVTPGAGKSQPLGMPLNMLFPPSFTGIAATNDSSMLNSPIPGSSVGGTMNSTSYNNNQLVLAESGKLPSIFAVHASWAKWMNQNTPGAIALESEPQYICNNNGVADWTIIPTNSIDVENGNFFYSTNQLPGLYVLATYNGGGKVSSQNLVGTSVSLSNFTNIGANFGEAGSSNALIDVGTGAVLVIVSGASAGTTVMAPLMRYSVPSGTGATAIPSMPLSPILLDPLEVVSAAFAFQKSNYQNNTISQSLLTRIASAQGNVTNTGVMGPYSYAGYSLTIDRQLYNDGNYIYTAKNSSGSIVDYLITYNIGAKPSTYNSPFSQNLKMVSLLNGRLFSSTGINNSTNGGVFFGVDIDLADIPTTMEGYVTGVSGNQIVSATDSNLIQNINLLAEATNTPVINGNNVIDNSTSLEDQILVIAQKLPLTPSVQNVLNSAVPVQSTIGQFTTFNTELGILTGQLVQDSSGNFYLRSVVPNSFTGTGSTGKTSYSYYQFDISQSSTLKKLDTNSIVGQPTGVFYDKIDSQGNLTASSVTVGPMAVKMLNAYGLSVNPSTLKLTLGLPMVRPSLPMSVADYNAESNTGLMGGATGFLMQRLPGTSVVSSSKADYYFYKNIFHSGASVEQLLAAANSNPPTVTNPNYATYNDPYSPYDLLLQVNPKSPSQELPYFTSLLTGISYGLDGAQLYENVQLYFQNVSNSSSASASNLPLVIWGDSIADTKALLGSDENSTSEGTKFVNFNTYQVDSFGWSFEYVSPTDSSNNPVIYTLTYQDPSYYLTTGNPSFSFQSYPPTAVADSNGDYISQIIDANGNITYSIENSDGKGTPLVPGQIWKIDTTGKVISVYGSSAVIRQPNLNSSITENNDATLSAITDAVANSMYLALTDSSSGPSPLSTLGTVYKMSTGANPSMITSYYANGTPSTPLFDTDDFDASSIDVSTDGAFTTTIIDQGYISLVLANMQLAQTANPISGNVFVVPSVSGAVLPTPLKAVYQTPLTPPAGLTAPTASQIEGAASQNMVNALADAYTAKLVQSRFLMKMTNLVTAGSTLQKIVLAQDSLGVYSLYQSNLLSNNGSPLVTYTLQPSELWKANVLSFVGTRPYTQGAPSSAVPTYNTDYFANDTVLIENVLKNTYDVIIFDNTVYMPVGAGGTLGTGLSSIKTINVLSNVTDPTPPAEPAAVNYAPFGYPGSTNINTTTGLSTDSSDWIQFSIKNYADLLTPGVAQSSQYTDSSGIIHDIWPKSVPSLLLNDAKYVSITAKFSPTSAYGVSVPTEWVFQYIYPQVDPNVIPGLLGSLGIALVGSTSGVITPIMSLPVANGAITLDGVTASPADAQTIASNAQSILQPIYNTAIANAQTAENSLSSLIASVNSDASSAVNSIPPQLASSSGGTCPAGTMMINLKSPRGALIPYCIPANALSFVGGISNSTNSVAQAITANQTETVAQLTLAVANATKAYTNLNDNLTTVTAENSGLLATRAMSRSGYLSNLYYRTVPAINENSNEPSTTIILYYKVDLATLTQLSPTTNATLGCYIEYPIGTEEAGYIYNGIAPTPSQIDSNGNIIPPALALGAPTGSSLSSSDMAILKSLVGTTLLLNSSGTIDSALVPDPTKNSIIKLTAGNSTLNNYFYFGDLLPGGSAFIVAPSSTSSVGGSVGTVGVSKKSTLQKEMMKTKSVR